MSMLNLPIPTAYAKLLPSVRMRIDDAVIEGDHGRAQRLYRNATGCDFAAARRDIAMLDRVVWEPDLTDDDDEFGLDWDF